jgi:plastocyanin
VNNKVLIGIVVAIVVIGGATGIYSAMQKDASAPSNSNNSSQSDVSNKTAAATITYSDSGFSPSKTTVKAGDTVAIKNTSSSELQFDSDPHPVHTDDEELNVGTVAPGETAKFTVTTKGTFGFHNHLNPGDTGTIVIQ